MSALLHDTGAGAYLTFSHDLPLRFPRNMPAIVGVSNLAPFSGAARAAETRLAARLRLDLLARTIVSSARRAQAVIALSQTCRELLIERGVEAARIEVIPNGVAVTPPPADPRAQAHTLAALGVRPGYVLYVSHFYRYKNFERLVSAFATVPPAQREGTQLVLVGHPWDGDYHRDILQQIAALGLAPTVQVVPGAAGQDLATLYANARVFVFPSLIENSPNILLEAMAHGLPVLASNIAPMPEFGGDAVDYFDPLSIEDMRARLEHALAASGDARWREAVGARSRARAAEFTWERFTERVVGLYLRVMQ